MVKCALVLPTLNSNGGNCDKIKIRVKLDFQRNFPTAAEEGKGSEFLWKQTVHNTLKAQNIVDSTKNQWAQKNTLKAPVCVKS